ncbi:YwdI family protein [Bacillus sp. FSL K6-3431]|uniref:YwdI family protein n=1 Tax=Bacillus sp. FSL K6-3431 TaxID=2921500 RepID=UPI0030F71B9B
MNISYEALLGKMELELKEAKVAKDEIRVKAHIYALKALAEVILEGENVASHEPLSLRQPLVSPAIPVANEPVTLANSKPLETEDGANGNSLFDF